MLSTRVKILMVIFVLLVSIHQAEGGFFKKVFRKVKSVVKKVVRVVKKTVKKIVRGVKKVGEKLHEGGKKVVKGVKKVVEGVKKVLTIITEALKKILAREKKRIIEEYHKVEVIYEKRNLTEMNGITLPPVRPTGPIHVVLPKIHNQLRKEEKSGSDLVSFEHVSCYCEIIDLRDLSFR